MIRVVFLYGFPLFLIALEWLLRLALKVDSISFVAPTLAGMGIGLALPLTMPSNAEGRLPANSRATLKRHRLIVFDIDEWRFVEFTWLVIFVMIIMWYLSVYFSAISQGIFGWELFLAFAFGAIDYLMSLSLPCVKGWFELWKLGN